MALAAVLQGEKHVQFADRTLAYAPGHFLLITGESRYAGTVVRASARTPYLSLSLVLSPELITDAMHELADADALHAPETEDARPQATPDPPAVIATLDGRLGAALVRLLETLSDPFEQAFVAPLVLREIVLRILHSAPAEALRRVACRRDERIGRALRYMRRRATERLSVEEIARHVAMSPSHFAHRFREVVRVSPMQFVRQLRLSEARLRLLDDAVTAREAATLVGYASSSQFSRDFKRQFGAAPGVYRARFLRDREGSPG